MRAIFLGAGGGTRLHPLTVAAPKWLLEINGQPILQHSVNVMHECNVTEIVVVRGRLGGRVKTPSVLYRDDLEQRNMVHTLFSVEDLFTDDIIVSYCDILYEPRLLQALLASTSPVAVLVDQGWDRYFRIRADDPMSIAESCVIENGFLTEIGQPLRGRRPQGQYVGLMRFSKGTSTLIRNIYHELKSEFTGRPWRNAPSFERAFMTDFLQELIERGIPVAASQVDGGWLEFDTARDYESVTRHSADGSLDEIIRLGAMPEHPAVLSAGGVVTRQGSGGLEVIVVGSGKPDEWRIPKGMQEPHENIEQTALREVFEETGSEATIDGYLGRLQWSYDYGGTRWDERVHFFMMHSVGKAVLVPDAEHRVAAWLPVDEAIRGMRYDGERGLLVRARDHVR